MIITPLASFALNSRISRVAFVPSLQASEIFWRRIKLPELPPSLPEQTVPAAFVASMPLSV